MGLEIVFQYYPSMTSKQIDNLIGEIYLHTRDKTPRDKPWKITISEEPETKTNKQLKGIHELVFLAKPYIEEWTGLRYNLEEAKQFMKYKLNFVSDPTLEQVAAMVQSYQSGKEPFSVDFRRKLIEGCKKFKQARSFRTATKQEMHDLIGNFEAFAASYIKSLDPEKEKDKEPWPEVYLTTEEKEEVLKFYDKK